MECVLYQILSGYTVRGSPRDSVIPQGGLKDEPFWHMYVRYNLNSLVGITFADPKKQKFFVGLSAKENKHVLFRDDECIPDDVVHSTIVCVNEHKRCLVDTEHKTRIVKSLYY